MRCQCRLTCRDEPIDEVDALAVACLLLLAGACAAFVACDSKCAALWMPLAAAAVVCVTGDRQQRVRNDARTALDALPAV